MSLIFYLDMGRQAAAVRDYGNYFYAPTVFLFSFSGVFALHRKGRKMQDTRQEFLFFKATLLLKGFCYHVGGN